MSTLWKIDAWIMAKHQWVADRVHSRIGMSPYELAAQFFGVVILLNMLDAGFRYSTADEASHVRMALDVLGVVVPSMWFWISIQRHKIYARTKMTPPRMPLDDGFRLFFMVIGAALLPGGIYQALSDKPVELLIAASYIFFVCAFYFFGCNAPTFIERKEHKLVPATEGA